MMRSPDVNERVIFTTDVRSTVLPGSAGFAAAVFNTYGLFCPTGCDTVIVNPGGYSADVLSAGT